MSKIVVTKSLVKELISKQFPQHASLPLKKVDPGGVDNVTFRLGEKFLIRMPSALGYASQVIKEQIWLPKLAPHLSLSIPKPVHLGYPNQSYPWNWSIYAWISGISLDNLHPSSSELEQVAYDLAKFIKELHKIPTEKAPSGGLHNYYRGCHPSVYDQDAKADIEKLKNIIDYKKALQVWKSATSSEWNKPPIWIHGDIASGNLLIRNSKLTAIIDFGCMGIGDPACDLVIAWTKFSGNSRKLFKDQIDIDEETWARARGWALWKANFEFLKCRDKSSEYALQCLKIIQDVSRETS